MAQAAVGSSAPTDLLIGRSGLVGKMKRKTPSELRGEQLKRRNFENIADDKLRPTMAFDRTSNALRNPGQQRIPKYINTRVTEVFPVKKSSERCRALYGKENIKEVLHSNEKSTSIGTASATSSVSLDASSLPCGDGGVVKKLESSGSVPKDMLDNSSRQGDKCSQTALRSVVELHIGDENLADFNKLDMEKALKGLGARDASATSALIVPTGKGGDTSLKSPDIQLSEIRIPGKRAPLDFTLKTMLQLVSSSSVKWCHRLSTSCASNSMSEFISQTSYRGCKNLGCTSRFEKDSEFLFSKALESWVYPQSSLPSSVIAAIVSSTACGGSEFLLKRQQDWEDSFQNLYYMLRKNLLNLFYVCTTQFVVLFLGVNYLGKKRSCNAYLSQSTRGLRSLLRKHDVCFSMPLCRTEVEEASEDDLVELSEIEKRNLGQAFHLDTLSEVDNTTQSLLSFIGNESVHGLYDFLLNYKSFLHSLSAADVPLLYSPAPFQNAALRVPEVRCKEMRKADMAPPSSSGSAAEEHLAGFGSSAGNVCYSIELKDTILPPWVISGICAAMSSDGRSFDSIFATEPSSMGLNVAFNSICTEDDPKMPSSEICESLGIHGAALVPSLNSASLRRLTYTEGAYVAYTTV